ncbi:MAG: Smr/MutS family protein [Flavobacteriales bacterium]|jgi:DNA-nicking Smr family endonuclease
MEFRVGDLVRFLNDEGGGKIVSFPDEFTALVEDESGFAFEHPVGELVHIIGMGDEYRTYSRLEPDQQEMLSRNIDPQAVKKAASDFKSRYASMQDQSRFKKGDVQEVDLHIHELLDRHEGMSNSEIISIQLEHFERMLRNAEEKKVQRIIFIHGVGQGVLRSEIRKMLRDYYPQCEFLDAPYHIYGYGATEVRIRPGWKMW